MVNLFLLLLFLHLATAAIDLSVCSEPLIPAPTFPRPVLPPQFEVHIDCIIVNKNLTTEVHEFYDQKNNRGEMRQTLKGVHFYAYYDYSANEFLGIFPQQSTCAVSDLSTSEQRFLFGYNKTNSPNGGGHIFSAAAALHFGATTENYQGKDIVRGINVEKWFSCQYWPGMDATMTVYWYFSDHNTWNMALGLDATPVRGWVKGKIGSNGETPPHSFEHYYDFIHFKPFIQTPQAFETPSFVTCPGRKLTKVMARVAPEFSFGIEILDEKADTVSYMKEWYDFYANVTKYVYTPSVTTSDGRFGYRPLTEIHDFNTGVAYIIDNQMGNCTVQKIEQSNFDDISKDPYNVRIRTSQQFFYMNSSGITYEGVRTTRGIPADVYVAKRSDFPPGSPVNSTFEWYFKTDDYTFVQDAQATYPGARPVQMRVDMPQSNLRYSYNIYNYVPGPADILTWDLSPCYLNRNIRKFQFYISGMFKNIVGSRRTDFSYSLADALSYYARVSELRITNLKVAFYDNIQVQFDLLDVAPISGDVISIVTQTPLSTAASYISNAINTGRLVVLMYLDPTKRPVAMTPIRSSLTEIIEGSTVKVTMTTTPIPTNKVQTTHKPQTNPQFTNKPVTNVNQHSTRNSFTNVPPVTSTSGSTSRPVTTPSPHPGSTSKLGVCETSGGGYSGGVALGVSAVMILVGGAMGTGTALYLKRTRRGRLMLE